METVDIQAIIDAYGDGGWLAVAAAAVTVAIRVWRRPGVQDRLPAGYQWTHLPLLARWAIVGLGALVASVMTGLATGVSWPAACAAAVPVALAAVVGHKATKAAGHAQTRAAMRSAAERGIEYEPTSIRTSLDTLGVLPIDRKAASPK